MIDINWNPSRRELRQFAGIGLPAFTAIVGTLVYRSGGVTAAVVIWTLGALVAAAGVAAPERVRPLFVGWMAAAYPIGWTVSNVVLAIVYFAFFTFVGLLMRLLRYDPLDRAVARSSYWRQRSQPASATTYFRQF